MYETIYHYHFFFVAIQLHAQFSVRLIVNTVATKANDDIYVAGNFNNWNPKDENYKLKPFGGSRKSIVLKNMAPGTYAFKFTRGGFDKVETLSDGRDISDRVLEVNNDISLEFDIPGWKDEYPDKPKRYSASPQVRVLDTAFNMPQLNRKEKSGYICPKVIQQLPKAIRYCICRMHKTFQRPDCICRRMGSR